MEVRGNRLCLLFLFFMAGIQIHSFSQTTVKAYTVKNGKMLITLGKNLKSGPLDSFIVQFNLAGLDLPRALKSNSFDSLKKEGWDININNKQVLVISKVLEPMKNINNPAEEILIAEKHPTMAERFPAITENVSYGFNRFRNKFPFASRDSMVTFFMRDHLQGTNAWLAGSFNNWDPRSLPMIRTDSGWIALVKLTPGKYWYKFIIDGNWELDKDNMLKEDDGYGNTNSVFYKPNEVFRLNSFANARKLYLAGSFNDWKPEELEMHKVQGGWECSVYLARGTHTYKFIVDGRWIPDPGNPVQLPDGFNGFNSVLQIGDPYIFKLDGFTHASGVILSGSFNHWRKDELFMYRTSTGWTLPYILVPGNYEYNFIIDGKWAIDPGNPLSLTDKENKQHSFLIVAPNYTFILNGYGNSKKVFLAGDFNDWNPSQFPMKRQNDHWAFSLHLSIGKHLYKFIVDGKWIKDPANKLWEDADENSVLWMNSVE
jgi:hypothetical protein